MNLETNFTRQADGLLSSDEQELAQKSRRRKILMGVGAIILLAIILGARLMGGSGKPGAGADAGRQAPRVTVIVPGARDVESMISATGSLAARRDMPVGVVGEGGMVRQVLVDAGSWVRQGQVLAIVDRQVQAQQAACCACT